MKAAITTSNDTIVLRQPPVVAFGTGCVSQCVHHVCEHGIRNVFVVSGPQVRTLAAPMLEQLAGEGVTVTVWDQVVGEPTIETYEQALAAGKRTAPDAVIGFGGGSPLDVAKLVALGVSCTQDMRAWFGSGYAPPRDVWLACVPTTAGTGSEVSPNAVLLDESEQLKKGVVSPHLVPDAAYVDPALTCSAPSALTGATGMDALTHCIEAYVNRYANPMTDLYALEGIRLIAQHLPAACEHGDDMNARAAVARGSLYGGLCLGPVNTAAVHALAYPLGGEFRVPHGVSNAILLPHVLAFNLPAALQRYANVATAMGIDAADNEIETAKRGLAHLRTLSERCGIPASLAEVGVPESAIERMATAAMKVTRLLERNVREVNENDAAEIYRKAFCND